MGVMVSDSNKLNVKPKGFNLRLNITLDLNESIGTHGSFIT